jgi:predicted nucleic acid-binding protein
MKCFVDTNVLAYAKDSRLPSKQTIAKNWISALLKADAMVLSAQSLREHYSVSLRLDRSPAAIKAAREEIVLLSAYVPEDLCEDRLAEAWALEDRYRLAFFDCLLLAAALAARCTFFLSEDLQAGQKIGPLNVINPFTTAPEAVLGA